MERLRRRVEALVDDVGGEDVRPARVRVLKPRRDKHAAPVCSIEIIRIVVWGVQLCVRMRALLCVCGGRGAGECAQCAPGKLGVQRNGGSVQKRVVICLLLWHGAASE